MLKRSVALIWRAHWWQIVATCLVAAIMAIFLCLGWKWGLVALAITYYVTFASIGLLIAGGAAILAELFAMLFLGLFSSSFGGVTTYQASQRWEAKVWGGVGWFSLTFPFTWPYWLLSDGLQEKKSYRQVAAWLRKYGSYMAQLALLGAIFAIWGWKAALVAWVLLHLLFQLTKLGLKVVIIRRLTRG